MRPLNVPLSADALPALDTCIKQTKAARCFRRAQAVREVVKGNRIHPVADPLTFPSSALRKWVPSGFIALPERASRASRIAPVQAGRLN